MVGIGMYYVIIQHFARYQLFPSLEEKIHRTYRASMAVSREGRGGYILKDRRGIMSDGVGSSAASAGEYYSSIPTGQRIS